MLVLTRKVGEKIYLGDNIVLTVTAISGQIRLGISAPPEVSILRNELVVRSAAARTDNGRDDEPLAEGKPHRPLRMFRPGKTREPVA
jgi:carbon storage regulator